MNYTPEQLRQASATLLASHDADSLTKIIYSPEVIADLMDGYADALEEIARLKALAEGNAHRYFPHEFEVWQGDNMEASASGPRDAALAEAMNYAHQYAEDGHVRVFEVTRNLVAELPKEPTT